MAPVMLWQGTKRTAPADGVLAWLTPVTPWYTWRRLGSGGWFKFMRKTKEDLADVDRVLTRIISN